MTAEEDLREKLRKIEALFAGAATAGEKAAAGAAADRIRARLGKAAGSEAILEIKFSVPDVWSRQLFIALCRRYEQTTWPIVQVQLERAGVPVAEVLNEALR